MTLPSDNMVIDQPIISQQHFGDPLFDDNFTTLDVPTPGVAGSGKWSDKHWTHDFGLEGSWHEDYVPNDEWQRFVSVDDPTPDNWSPFAITSNGLRIRAEEVPGTAGHQSWSYIKSYDRDAAGRIRTTADYPGWPNVNIPHTSIPATPADYSLEIQADGTQRVLWLKYPARWRSGILTGRQNRAAIDQGRLVFVARMPSGGSDNGGGVSRDFRSTTFAALWLYGMIERLRNRNNEPRSNFGLYPYNSDGTLNELDVIEHSGAERRRIYHAGHFHTGAAYNLTYNYAQNVLDNSRKNRVLSFDPTVNFMVIVLDILFDKIGFAVSELGQMPRYTRIFDTPRVWHETKRQMMTNRFNDRVMVRNAESQMVEIGEQIDPATGNPRVQEMMPIMNVAMDGKWLLDQMAWATDSNAPYDTYAQLPDGRRYADMTVKHVSISPLIDARFSRYDGKLWQPHRSKTRATVQPWDGATAPGIVLPTPTITGFGTSFGA